MWLLPPDFPKRPLRLVAGCRALPWYASDDEVERLLELLLRMVPEIREWVRVPWSALSRVSGGEVRAGVAIVTEAPEDLAEDEARAIAEGVRWPYVFWQPTEPYERDGSWIEREVKRVLLSELRQGLSEQGHPLHEQGIGTLPVELVAEATDDPVELLTIVQGAVEHRLRHAEDGLGAEDWRYSVRRAVGDRLADRLAMVEEESLTAILESLLTQGERPKEYRARGEAGRRLQASGLAVSVGDSVAFGPLARQVEDAVVHGVLLERLPVQRWPLEEDGRGFLQPPMDKQGRARVPPTRVPGPTAPFLAELFGEVFEPVNEVVAKLDSNKNALILWTGALAVLWGWRLTTVPMPGEGRSIREEVGGALLNVEGLRLPQPEQNAAIELLRGITRLLPDGPPVDIASFLDSVEARASILDPPKNEHDRSDSNSKRLKAVVAYCMFDYVQNQEGLMRLLRKAKSECIAAHERNGRSLEMKIWLFVQAEVLRLMGDSAKAARGFRLGAYPFEGSALGSWINPWLKWGYARGQREAGYVGSALSELRLATSAASTLDRQNYDAIDAQVDAISSPFLQAHLSLELGHIERDRGSLTLARQWYARAREALADAKDEHLARYVELYALSTHIEEEAIADHEPKARAVLDAAERVGDLRLAIFASLVLGDISLRTSRFDSARDLYRVALERAKELGDLMSQASALEKLAAVDSALGRRETAIDLLDEAATRDATCERHEIAARLWGQAATMSRELGRSDDVERYLGLQVEQGRLNQSETDPRATPLESHRPD